jgi:hypothetical protein
MPQEPNIDISKIESKKEISMPVPRRTGRRPAENINPSSDEVFGNTGPDSGFALKIVNKYKNIWEMHPRKKLISSVVTNLIIYRASNYGRAPTVSDLHLVLGLLRISENSIGELNDEVLDKCAEEDTKGLYLIELFNFLS